MAGKRSDTGVARRVPAVRRRLRIGRHTIAARHPGERHVEPHVEEHREVPAVDQLIAGAGRSRPPPGRRRGPPSPARRQPVCPTRRPESLIGRYGFRRTRPARGRPPGAACSRTSRARSLRRQAPALVPQRPRLVESVDGHRDGLPTGGLQHVRECVREDRLAGAVDAVDTDPNCADLDNAVSQVPQQRRAGDRCVGLGVERRHPHMIEDCAQRVKVGPARPERPHLRSRPDLRRLRPDCGADRR